MKTIVQSMAAVAICFIAGCTSTKGVAPSLRDANVRVIDIQQIALPSANREYYFCELNRVSHTVCKQPTIKNKGTVMPVSSMLSNVPIAVVNFDFDKSVLTEEAKAVLDSLDYLELSGSEVLLRGYTDSIGGAVYNAQLAMDRAKSVETYLRIKGLTDGELIPLGYGLCCYVADNSTTDGREKNRRVEIYTRLKVSSIDR